MALSLAGLNPVALADALRAALPDADVARLAALAEALLAAARDDLPSEAAQAALREHEPLLRELRGREVTSGGVCLSFDGAQLGDVRIGNVAGGDIITISLVQTIVTAEQSYQVAGLPNPFLGLRPFTYAERARFAGRERLINVALAQLTAPGEERALLFVTGASGNGKSSFVQAGLLPSLEAHYGNRNLTLRHAVMRPSKQPLAALADALQQVDLSPKGPFAATTPFVLGTPMGGRPDVAVLVIDQFEELFTQSEPSQRDDLLALLATLPTFRELRVHIICTLRSDFLSEFAARRELESDFREQVLLRAMDEDELREAMQQPIQEAHPEQRIEPALLDRLVADAAGEASYLPLLQVTLEDLWRRGSLTLGSYSSLTDAIRDRAEQVHAFQDYDDAWQHPRNEAEQTLLMSLMLDLVEVSLDDESRRDVRRRRALAELTRNDIERTRVVSDLASARLLSTGVELRDGTQVEVVDIIHESLIANWNRLKQAIMEQRETLQRRVRFEVSLREWISRGKPDDYLLDGGRLADAQLLAEVGDVALGDAFAPEILSQSLEKRDEQRRRQLRRTQFIAAVLGVLLIVAVVAGGWAINRSNAAQAAEAQAEARLRISDAQRLAFAAQSVPTEPALQLAYEAYALDKNSISEFVLHELVNRRTEQITELVGHIGWLENAVFAPDGLRILTASQDGTARLWSAEGQPAATLSGHEKGVNSAVFSPDGRRILTASWDNTARVWNQDGQTLAILTGHTDWVTSAVFALDGSRILTASGDGTARLWDQDGQPIATLEGHTARVTSAVVIYSGLRARRHAHPHCFRRR